MRLLRYRHRDDVEAALHGYADSVDFDSTSLGARQPAVRVLREYRLRHHFGERYDFRTNLVDWDY